MWLEEDHHAIGRDSLAAEPVSCLLSSDKSHNARLVLTVLQSCLMKDSKTKKWALDHRMVGGILTVSDEKKHLSTRTPHHTHKKERKKHLCQESSHSFHFLTFP